MEFVDDDAGYLAWIDKHPNGLVLNLRHSPDPNYVVLHLAKCATINRPRDDGAYTSRWYRKAVSTEVSNLRAVARREGRSDGSFSNICGLCRPEAD